ncbi:hypothetical protein [Chondrinema litorale]|uniref:hypothetical protein n=1 Tax=Chondrinema litorale TaxID=2994555 RepID=UPI002542A282|nr:hypothetical protein [Chondrinema litorale]UZR94519.1 hypothetical protein OQ292_01630 [Chondrinema litorale]
MAEQVKEKEDKLEREDDYYTGIEPYMSRDSELMISFVIVLGAIVILVGSIIYAQDLL